MPRRLLLVAGVLLSFGQAWGMARPARKKTMPRTGGVPLHRKGTVAEHAILTGGGDLPVQGYGLVVGLGKNGSRSAPPHVTKYLTRYLKLKGVGSATADMMGMRPGRILRDLDTAVVLIGGSMPMGAPRGTRFDVFVSALPRTETRSLEGGALLEAELRLAVDSLAIPGGPTRAYATACGDVFVNPFLSAGKTADLPKLREGRILRGGVVLRDRPVILQLRQPDYARAQLIQRRINGRFGSRGRVATAKNLSTIELRVPADYRQDYLHFLELVMHLSLRSGKGAWERQAKEVAAAIASPGARHESLALVWEAMGKEVVPLLRGLYTSKDPAAAFHAARTGMRLADRAAESIVVQFAASANCPWQIPAIEELGRHISFPRAVKLLRRLIDSENEQIRIAAYKSLLRHNDVFTIETLDISGQFKLDLIKSRRSYVICATQSGQPRIVLFGRDMSVSRPIFFLAPDDLVTIDARSQAKKLTVYRKIPGSERFSELFHVDFHVRSLIKTLGSLPRHGPDGKIQGLGLTFGQVVGVLHRMCRKKDIRAKFVLQRPTGTKRIYRGAARLGRPDMPGE